MITKMMTNALMKAGRPEMPCTNECYVSR